MLASARFSDEKKMDFYRYFWGLLKYYIPAILLIISIVVEPNILLLIIAVVWIVTSLFISLLLIEDETRITNYH